MTYTILFLHLGSLNTTKLPVTTTASEKHDPTAGSRVSSKFVARWRKIIKPQETNQRVDTGTRITHLSTFPRARRAEQNDIYTLRSFGVKSINHSRAKIWQEPAEVMLFPRKVPTHLAQIMETSPAKYWKLWPREPGPRATPTAANGQRVGLGTRVRWKLKLASLSLKGARADANSLVKEREKANRLR